MPGHSAEETDKPVNRITIAVSLISGMVFTLFYISGKYQLTTPPVRLILILR